MKPINTTSALLTIGETLARILSRVLDIGLSNTRRFDRIDRALLVAHDERVAIEAKLDRLLAGTFPGPAASLYLELFDEAGNITDQGALPMQANINRHTSRTFKITPKDSDGNVTTLDGALSVESANAAITLADLSADGLSGRLVAGSLAGSGPVSFHGDADLTTGTREVAGSVDITVPAGEAMTIDIELGEEAPTT
jgi:hypothetical protein